MVDVKQAMHKLVEELSDEKKDLEIKLQVAKLELEDEFDELQEKYANKDEWRVRMHLAKLELEEEWDKLEEKLEQLKTKAGKVTDASEEKLQEGLELAKSLGDEIKQGLGKIRDKIKLS